MRKCVSARCRFQTASFQAGRVVIVTEPTLICIGISPPPMNEGRLKTLVPTMEPKDGFQTAS